MLTHLSIRNMALVDAVDLELDPGLTVLTGETGAGKSVLVQAFSMLLGGRASSDMVRSGADEAVVEGLFRVEPQSELAARLRDKGIEVIDDELVVRRTTGTKRSRVHLNGQMATISMLQDVLRGQLDVTGQHEHVTLLDPDAHLRLLDRWAGLDTAVDEVTELHRVVVGYRAMLEQLDTDEGRRAQREDYLRFALEELAQLAPEEGEVGKLEGERNLLRNGQRIQEAMGGAEGLLASSDPSVCQQLGRVERDLQRVSDLDPELQSFAATAERLRVEADELARGLQGFQRSLDHDPEALQRVDDRLDQLRRLMRKYGGTLESVLAAQREMEEELDALEHDEVRRADLDSALEASTQKLQLACDRLREARVAAADRLSSAVQNELADLAMEATEVRFRFQNLTSPGARGTELVEIELSPNPGEPLRPLRKVASGGELSRVLLAFKRVLADRDPSVGYVFDEIDAGIGGAVAEVLGRKLREVARTSQVVCVTHLPQVAAQAQIHVMVEKIVALEGRTETRLRRLEAEERVEELARMLGGVRITEKVRSAAREMLQGAAAPRRRTRRGGGRGARIA